MLFGKLRAVSSVLFVLLHAKRKLCRRTVKGEATSSNNRGRKPEKKKNRRLLTLVVSVDYCNVLVCRFFRIALAGIRTGRILGEKVDCKEAQF